MRGAHGWRASEEQVDSDNGKWHEKQLHKLDRDDDEKFTEEVKAAASAAPNQIKRAATYEEIMNEDQTKGYSDPALRISNYHLRAWGGSAGGFSWYNPAPAYQREAVKAYLKSQKQFSHDNGMMDVDKGWFNRQGRGYPDISSFSQHLVTVMNGGFMHSGGTSAATPLVAGVIATLNSYRLADGQKPLGFLNPFLYQNSDAFTDVIEGSNGGECDHDDGFHAAKGWDPTTGLGIPNFQKLKQRALAPGGK